MRKLFFLFTVLCCLIFRVQARPVTVDKAQAAAVNFMNSLGNSMNGRKGLPLQLAYQEVSKASVANARTAPATYYYVFNIGQEQGMIFVSGDDKVSPILGYTEAGSYMPVQLPPHFLKWLEYYKNEIRFAIESLPEQAQKQQEWQSLLEGAGASVLEQSSANAVSPLVASKWDQSPYYNQLCPYDSKTGQRTVTGCVATAMAQIMRYWEYPVKGTGFHSYNHQAYGTLSANFSSTTYDWNNMPMQLTTNNTAVATLMAHVGISVDMDYDVAANGGSGAYVISGASPVQHCAEYALKTYFGYAEAKGVQKASYTQTEWISLLKQQLNAGQPVLYAGYGSGGGHAFVCDGYNNDYFHMNWGWGGYADGYFAISALNPDGVGTGGGTGGFNSGHQAVIDIKAPTAPAQSPELQLYANVELSASTLYYTQGFSLTTDIINKGNTTFRGEYAAAAFDAEGNFVDFIQTFTDNELPAGYHYTGGVSFATEGMISLLPGTYTVAVFYKSGAGEWQQLMGEGYTSTATMEVIYPNDLELASAYTINNGADLYSNGEVSVSLTLKNDAPAAFTGSVALNLYKLDGSFAHAIETKQNISICAGCTAGSLTFTNSAIALEPGTYLVAALFSGNPDQWDLAGSSYFTNPAKVVVKTAPLAADGYENNNEPSVAYLLPQEFAATEKKLVTEGANIHLGTDYDFYKLNIPADGNYRIALRVHDAYSSSDGKTYSNDVLFSYSTDGENWSDAYDDLLPARIEAVAGSTLYVFVASFFQGETGTYALETTVNRLSPNGVEDPGAAAQLEVYPNPTTGLLQFSTEKSFDAVELLSLSGRILKLAEPNARQLDLTDLPAGMYLLRARSGNGVAVKKIVKQ